MVEGKRARERDTLQRAIYTI